MSKEDRKLLNRIRVHLYNLHSSWQNDPGQDGHCKSNEGFIGYSTAYPNWFDADDYLNDKPEIYDVEVYSYLFGPHRLHKFGSLKEAWTEVKTWEYEPTTGKE